MKIESTQALQDHPATLGEAPMWCTRNDVLYWIDTIGKKIFRFDPARDSVAERNLSYRPSALAPRPDGTLLLAFKKGIALYDFESDSVQSLDIGDISYAETVLNDGACDRRGRFWIGSRDKQVSRPVGALYRIDGELNVATVLDGIVLSNGIAWSPDDRIMYHTDSFPDGRVDAYDFDIDSGSISNRRTLLDYHGVHGHPDGCTVDADGGLWVAEVESSRVVRYSPSGEIDRIIETPVSKPTSVMFGGRDLATLFITSMRYGLSERQFADEPLAGTVMMLAAGVKGMPEHFFSGPIAPLVTGESSLTKRA